ncbi:MAG: hypothetical protein COT84_03125, partial [Chlamydiae bacterium CG10_big_fil_rev_8_21_14_0_10_35_9]
TFHKGYRVLKQNKTHFTSLIGLQILTVGALFHSYLAFSSLGLSKNEFSSKGQQNLSLVLSFYVPYIIGKQLFGFHKDIWNVGNFATKRDKWIEEAKKVSSTIDKNLIISEAAKHLSFLRSQSTYCIPPLSQTQESSFEKEIFDFPDEDESQITTSNVVVKMENLQVGFFSTFKKGFQLSKKINKLSEVVFRCVTGVLGGYAAYRGLVSINYSEKDFSSTGEQLQNTYLSGFVVPFFVVKEAWKTLHYIWKLGYLEKARERSIGLLKIKNRHYQQEGFFEKIYQYLSDLQKRVKGVPFSYISEKTLKKEAEWTSEQILPQDIVALEVGVI